MYRVEFGHLGHWFGFPLRTGIQMKGSKIDGCVACVYTHSVKGSINPTVKKACSLNFGASLDLLAPSSG